MMEMQEQALAGLKVLDLSRVLAGPWCTQVLADFGADVLKIEPPGRGDDTRAWGPPFLHDAEGAEIREQSAYYLSCNRNKRSLAVNLADPDGAALVRELAAKADVVVENFRVGGLAKYGLDYASLSAVNPRLVYCSITGFGQTGPYADRGGYDFVVQAMGGFMSITGEAGGGPLRAGVAIADLFTGMYATTSILIALRHAEATGQGQHIDLALLDTQAAMLANQGMNWLVGGVVPGRIGNRHPTIVPYTTFDTGDGTVVIAVGNDGQFRALCRELGVAALADDPRFATSAARLTNRDAIEAEVQRLVGGLSSAELIDRLVACGVPAGPVNDIRQLFEDPNTAARGTVQHFAAEGADIPSVAFPGKLSETPATYRSPPPRVGEHSDELLRDWLGIGEERLEKLHASGTVVQR